MDRERDRERDRMKKTDIYEFVVEWDRRIGEFVSDFTHNSIMAVLADNILLHFGDLQTHTHTHRERERER